MFAFVTDPAWWAITLGINLSVIMLIYVLVRGKPEFKNPLDQALIWVGSAIVSFSIWFVAVLASVR